MARDNININVKGVGSAKDAQSGSIDTSKIQSAINQVANDLKKLNTTNFQKNLQELTFNIQKAATAAINYTERMQQLESKLSGEMKQSLTSGGSVGPSLISENKKTESNGSQVNPTEKFTKSINSLSDSIEKLASNLKKGGTPGEETPEKPETKQDSLIDNFKKLIAAVGVFSIAKEISQNEVLSPNRAAGSLINSNVAASPIGAGNELLSSFQNRVAAGSGTIGGGIGAGLGAVVGSLIPGAGTLIGAGLGYAAGSSIGGSIGQNKMATELPTLQRSLTTDYYSNLSKQIPQYNEFAKTQYGNRGFNSTEAFQDPYLESKAALGKSYSRFAAGTLAPDTTQNILKSLTAQGASSPQELNITGNLLGQIARFSGKTSMDIEKVYKAVEKSGMNPNEGLQKTLSLLQSGLSIKEAENVIQKTSQKSEAFSAGQQSYYSASPFAQFTAQQVGKSANFDVERFYQGNEAQAKELREISRQSNEELRQGQPGPASIRLQMLESVGIMPAMGDTDKAARGVVDKDFIQQSKTQDKIIDATHEAIVKGAKGREPSQIVDETLSEIGKSTQSFSALSAAAESLGESFKHATESFFHFVKENSPIIPKKNLVPITNTQGGR